MFPDNPSEKSILNGYKNTILHIAEKIINEADEKQIQFLECWTNNRLLPEIEKNYPEHLQEIKSFAQDKIITIKNVMNRNHSP